MLGVAHPPGYPLHTLLGALFAHLPLGESVAWRVNLLSAACDAGAAFLLCRAVSRWAGSVWAGVMAAGLFAFSPLVWPYAVTAEVFPLNNLFAAALLDLSVTAAMAPSPVVLPLSAFAVGLGLTNHHTLVFLGAPLILWLLFLERGTLSRRRLGLAALSGAVGLVPYAYLPIAAAAHPPLLWGDPTTWNGFLTHLLRREYGTFRLASAEVGSGGDAIPRILQLLERFAATTFWTGPTLVVLAMTSLGRPSAARRLVVFWTSILAFYLIVFSSLANVRLDNPLHVTVQERFWQQALVVASALAGVGLASLGRLAGRGGTAIQAIVGLAVTATLAITGFAANDLRGHTLFRNYGAAILESMPPRAILLVTSDEAIGSVQYLARVEGLRPDVRLIPTGQLASPWFRGFAGRHLPGVVLPPGDFTARQFVEANIGSSPIFLLNKIPWLETLEESAHPWPIGLADQVLPRPAVPDLAAWAVGADGSFKRFDPAPATRFPDGSWERYVATNYWKQYERFARALVSAAAPRGPDPEAARIIVEALEPLADAVPARDPVVLKNLGVALQNLSATEPGARARMVLYWRRYLVEGPGDDPDRATMARAIAADSAEPAAR